MRACAGFTLAELIVVIVITAIISGVVAVFLQTPVESYFDTARRAELTDTADTALRRMARDLRLSLPNSVRVATSGGNTGIELLQTRTGGRYRADGDGGATPADELDFTATDSSFDFLGTLSNTPVAGDLIVVYNLGIQDADAYAGDNSSSVTGVAGSTISINAKQFPFESPGKRFHVVSGPVSYVCSGVGTDASGNGTGELKRHWGYAIVAAQAVPPASGTNNALLADHVSACSIVYQQGVTARSGLVSMQLQISREGESVSLYHEVHVPNVP
jgi:MSHA biogenesis protein MshO